MPDKSLNSAYIVINNENAKYLANSLSVIKGFGEVNTRSQQTGGGGSEAIHTLNGETMISQIKFTMASTIDNNAFIDKLQELKAKGESVVVQVLDGEFAGIYSNSMLTNDPEMGFGQDGQIPVEMKGNKEG